MKKFFSLEYNKLKNIKENEKILRNTISIFGSNIFLYGKREIKEKEFAKKFVFFAAEENSKLNILKNLNINADKIILSLINLEHTEKKDEFLKEFFFNFNDEIFKFICSKKIYENISYALINKLNNDNSKKSSEKLCSIVNKFIELENLNNDNIENQYIDYIIKEYFFEFKELSNFLDDDNIYDEVNNLIDNKN